MKFTWKRATVGLAGVAALAASLLVGVTSGATAEPAAAPPPKAPASSVKKAPIPADSAKHKAKSLKAKGPTAARSDVSANADAYVYMAAPIKYCSNFVYLPVVNTSAVTKYYQLQVYTANDTRNFYGSVTANTTSYPYFYGISGNYTAYLYVWDGTSYSYDSYASGNVNCGVSVATLRSGNYIRLAVTNYGNTYASVRTAELAPYPAYGTYTGEHWVYPASGGGVAYQWYYLGPTGTRYAVIADNSGSTYNAWTYYGAS